MRRMETAQGKGKTKGKRARVALVVKTSTSPAAIIKSPLPASDSVSFVLENVDDKRLRTLQRFVVPDMTTSCETASSDRLNTKFKATKSSSSSFVASISPTTVQPTDSRTTSSQLSSISDSNRVDEIMAETCSVFETIKRDLNHDSEFQTAVKQHGMSNPLNLEMRDSENGMPFEEQMSDELGPGQMDWETRCKLMKLRPRAPERIYYLVSRVEKIIAPHPLTLYSCIIEFYSLKFPEHLSTDLRLAEWDIEEYVNSRNGKLMNAKEAEQWEAFLTIHYEDEIKQHGFRNLCKTYLWKLAKVTRRGSLRTWYDCDEKLTPKLAEEAVQALCDPLMELFPGDKARKVIYLRVMADAERFGVYDQSPGISQSSTSFMSSSLSPTTVQPTDSRTTSSQLSSISDSNRVDEIMAETCSVSETTKGDLNHDSEFQTAVKQDGMSNPLNLEMRDSENEMPFEEQMSDELGPGQMDWETRCKLMKLRPRAPERIYYLVSRVEKIIAPHLLTLYSGIIEFYSLKFPEHISTDLRLAEWDIEEYVNSRNGKLMNAKEAEQWEAFLTIHYEDEIKQHGFRNLCKTYLWKLAKVTRRGSLRTWYDCDEKLTPKLAEEAVQALCDPLMELFPGDKARKVIYLRVMADAERFGVYDQ